MGVYMKKNSTNQIGKAFMEYTQYKYLSASGQSLGYPYPALQKKEEDGSKIIVLPDIKNIKVKELSIQEAINNRTSIRNYSKEALSLDELSYLLWCTQGIKEVINGYITLRTVPSAGARHAFETYLLVNNVNELTSGLYRYMAVGHSLVKLSTDENIDDLIMKACLNQEFIKTSAVTFIWSAAAYKMKWRYGERGYRYMHLDAGHVCQNLYLSAESIDCGVCAVGAFLDDEIASALNIDGEEEFVIYLATLGKK